MLEDQLHPASIENTIRRTFAFEEGPLWDSPSNIRCINAVQDGFEARDRNQWANAPPRSQYGGTVPPEMQVEGEPTVYWKGLPKMFTVNDYDSDKVDMLLTENFTMGLPSYMLSRTLTQWGYRPQLGTLPSGRGRRVPSKDMRERQPYPGAHTRVQSSHWHQFDEDELSTYHSAKESLSHGPVRRGTPNVFGGRGQTPYRDASLQQSGDMPPLSQLPPRHRPRTPSQLSRQGGSAGQMAPGMPFAGVPMGPVLPPPVLKMSLPAASGWTA